MSIKIEKTEKNNELKLEFTIEAKKFDEGMKKVYAKSAKYINIPGFRKGKAPMAIVEKHYGPEVFYEDTFNEIVPEEYERELKENNIDAVSRPDIEVKQIGKGQDLIFTAVVQTKPEVKLGKYKGIQLNKVEYNVSDEDINHELGHMAERNSRLVTVEDRAVEDGDITVIDFEGFVDGVAFEGGKAENHELTIGSKTFIPGFEDQIIGMKIDEVKDINVKFPEEYFSAELAGKDAIFKVKLHEIKKKELPELDDEFAKDVSEFDTLDELKKDIKAKLQESADARLKQEKENAAIDAVIETMEADVPDCMVDSRIESTIRENNARMAQQGISFEQYLGYMGTTVEQFKEQIKPNAELQVKGTLALEEIAKLEKLEATDEEVDEQLKKMADAYKMELDKVKEFMRDEDINSLKKSILMC